MTTMRKVLFTLSLVAILKGPMGTDTWAKQAISDKNILMKVTICSFTFTRDYYRPFSTRDAVTLQSNIAQGLSFYGFLNLIFVHT